MCARLVSENGESTVHGLFKFMKCYKFVTCVCLLSDELPHLSRLSRIFQKKDVDLSLIQPCLKTTIDVVKEYLHNQEPNLSKIDHVLATDLKDFQIVATDTYTQKSLAYKQSTFKLLLTSFTTDFHMWSS